VLDSCESSKAPDGTVYKACGTRRAALCPACAQTYRTDASMLLRAGLAGLDAAGVPDTVATHPVDIQSGYPIGPLERGC
jgi:replication initiator protein RepSA